MTSSVTSRAQGRQLGWLSLPARQSRRGAFLRNRTLSPGPWCVGREGLMSTGPAARGGRATCSSRRTKWPPTPTELPDTLQGEIPLPSSYSKYSDNREAQTVGLTSPHCPPQCRDCASPVQNTLPRPLPLPEKRWVCFLVLGFFFYTYCCDQNASRFLLSPKSSAQLGVWDPHDGSCLVFLILLLYSFNEDLRGISVGAQRSRQTDPMPCRARTLPRETPRKPRSSRMLAGLSLPL